MAEERSRSFLRNEFDDGERPTGADFADLIESSLNKVDDGVSLDSNSNLTIPGGLNLGDTPNGQAGTLRFNNGQVEVFDGGAFTPLGGSGGGAFTAVGGTQHVAYQNGNVGVGNFPNPPTHMLDVEIGANTSEDQRVRFGQLTVHNGAADDGAYISHRDVAGDNDSFALRQDSQGNTTINSPANTQLTLQHDGDTRMQVFQSGNMTISPQASLAIAGDVSVGSIAQNENLSVFGQAFKIGGGPFANLVSDARVKTDIHPLEIGLSTLCKLEPVHYRYKESSGLSDEEHIGLTAQNVQEHIPMLIKESPVSSSDANGSPLLTYDRGPLEFIMINAIKELAAKVQVLEQKVKELSTN